MREDWIESTIGEICDFIGGGTPSKSEPTFWNGEIPWASIKDIKGSFLNKTIDTITQKGLENSSANLAEVDNIILATRINPGRPIVSKIKVAVNQDLKVVKPKIEIDKMFLFYGLLTHEKEVLKKSSGTTVLGINLNNLKEIVFLIPPLPEQRAIVAKIEQLFSELDNGIANLSTAQEQLKVYRQAVLKKAFEGGFTTEWREKQTDYATINKLLEQLSKERQDFYKEQIEEWKKAVKEWEIGGKKTKKPSRISKPKEFAKVKLSDIEDYDSLPGNWAWSRFGSITYKVGDIDHKMPKTVPKGMPYLSTGNIGKDGKVDFENAKLISKEDFKRLALKIKPQKGDIIFPRYGTIGRNILIDFDKEFLVSYSCAIIKNITKLMDEKFILYYSLSPVIKKEIKKYTVETTQANIGIASIEMFVFPLCAIEEQHQIVKEIESRLSVCDKVEETIAENLQKAEALRQSILKKAFAGELLTDAELTACKKEPDWEPAGELLKRIKKEKTK